MNKSTQCTIIQWNNANCLRRQFSHDTDLTWISPWVFPSSILYILMPGKYTILQCNNLVTWNVLVTQVYGDPMPLKYSAILLILGSWLHDSLYTKALSNSLYIRSVAKKPSFLLDLILAARKPAICIFWMYHILQPTHPPRSLSQDKMMLGYSHLSGILSGNLPSSTNSLLRFPQSPVCFKTLSLSYFFNPGNNIRWCVYVILKEEVLSR